MFRIRRVRYSPNKKSQDEYRRGLRGCVDKIKRRHKQIMIESGSDPYDADTVRAEFALERICGEALEIKDPIEYAAFTLECMNIYHPFTDGNKRTSLAVALKILESNGYTLDEGPELERFIIDIASGKYDCRQIEIWLRNHVRIIRRVF